jgi:hypothetical protein
VIFDIIYRGHIENGIVILGDVPALAHGTLVEVFITAPEKTYSAAAPKQS